MTPRGSAHRGKTMRPEPSPLPPPSQTHVRLRVHLNASREVGMNDGPAAWKLIRD